MSKSYQIAALGVKRGYPTDDFIRAILRKDHKPCVDVVPANLQFWFACQNAELQVMGLVCLNYSRKTLRVGRCYPEGTRRLP